MRERRSNCTRFLILAAVVTFLLISTASNSRAITISGTVGDSAGTPAPLPGIYVGLYYQWECGWMPAYTGITDGTGSYSIDTGEDAGPFVVGATDNAANPNCGVDYVPEYWNSSDTEPHTCQNASVVGVTTSGVNFTLQDGINISGTVTRAVSGAPVDYVFVTLNMGSACGGHDIAWVQTDLDGKYCFTVPKESVDLFYVSAGTTNISPGLDLASEWYTTTDEPYYCQRATGIGSDTDKTIDFTLEDGGTISGTVLDNTGAPINGMMVQAQNDALGFGWIHAWTDADGKFTIGNLTRGPWLVMIRPEIPSGLVHLNRDYWLNSGQDRNIGTLSLQQGALVTGFYEDVGSNPVELEYSYGGKFEVGWGWSAFVDGSFQFRLPFGTFALNNLDAMDSDYATLPQELDVTDVGTTYNLGDLTAYDDASGDHILGAVTDGAAHTGQLVVISFLSGQQFTPDKFGGLGPLRGAQPAFPGDGSYSIFAPPDETVDVLLGLLVKDAKGLES